MDKELASLQRAFEADPSNAQTERQYRLARDRVSWLNHIAVISDVAGNLTALEAVLDDIEKRGIPNVISLGNMFGFGAAPVESLRRLLDTCRCVNKGSFEELLSPNSRNPAYAERRLNAALKWSKAQLSGREFQSLLELPETFGQDGYLFSWGCPRAYPTIEPMMIEDIYNGFYDKLEETFAMFEKILFVGNSDYPFFFNEDLEHGYPWDIGGHHRWDSSSKLVVNTGYVGRNRVGGQGQSIGYPPFYVEYKHPDIFWHFVDYDAELARQNARSIPDIGEFCAYRLSRGPGEPIWNETWTRREIGS